MILGLCGYSGSGKDTAADYLVAKHGFTRVAFADKVRDFALHINPLIRTGERYDHSSYPVYSFLQEIVKDIGWDRAKREYMQVREFLQKVGHGARETFGDTFWIEQAITPELLRNDRIVVTDVRYQNEVEHIVDLDGFIIRIEREDVGPVNDHITEKPLPFDYVVKNKLNYVQGLYSNLDELVRNITNISY